MPILGLLGVLFVGLKLAEVITWSWWLVLLPFYGLIAVFAAMFVIATVAAVMLGKA